jgi:hypothetical protein
MKHAFKQKDNQEQKFLQNEVHTRCRNPSLRLATKVRAYKVVGQEGSPRVTPHAFGSVRKCEGMNPHTPKGASES